MHVLMIIIFTPLAIALGLILLGLVFTPWAWKAFGFALLGIMTLLLIVAIVPKQPVAPVAPKPVMLTPLPAVSKIELAERAYRHQWIRASKVDYPYMRAWAGLQSWSPIHFEDELRIARHNKAPADTVHRQGAHWVGVDDIESPTMLSILDHIVRKP